MQPEPTETIDPALCRPAPGRAPPLPSACEDLVVSIRQHGQIQPAIVRLTPAHDTHPFEIVAGHRRHAAITALRAEAAPGEPLPTLRVEIRDLTDEAAFATADQDNRHRRDIPDYHRALAYADALARHYGGLQAAMADRLAIDPGTLNRYLKLAAMPEIIVKAFGDANVTISHYAKLAAYLKTPDQHTLLIEEATRIVEDIPFPGTHLAVNKPPAYVLRFLIEAVEPPPPRPVEHCIFDDRGHIVATGRLRTGKPGIHFTSASQTEAEITQELSKILNILFDTGPGCTVQPRAAA